MTFTSLNSNPSIGLKIGAGLATVMTVFASVAALSFTRVTGLEESAKWVDHTHKVLAEIDEVLLALVNIETGMRGFAVTGVEEFLEPYEAGLEALDNHFTAGRTLTLDNPTQTERWDELQPKLDRIIDETNRIIDLRRAEGGEAAAAAVSAGLGKAIMDDIRVSLDELAAEEEVLLVVRAEETASNVSSTKIILVVGLGMAVLAVLLVAAVLRNTVKRLKASADQLRTASAALGDVSNTLGDSASRTSDQADAVAAGGDQVSNSVSSVAVAIEQLNSSIREVASSAVEASGVSADAVETAGATSETIARLGASSEEIGDVVKVINSIAEQTNLLALNATIEAARAGSSGKGFAVVANEVKELANQTAKATDEISSRVQGIQHDTRRAVEANHQIQETIEKISDISATIASAVEEQSVTTADIGQSIEQTAAGTREIAGSISEVASLADNTLQSTVAASSSAEHLATMASDLGALVGHGR